MKKTKNSLLFMIVSVIAFIAVVVIGVSYAYTNSYNASGNIIYNVTVEDKYKFITTGNTIVNTTIDNIKMFGGTSDKVVFTDSQSISVKLESNNSRETTCSYKVVWEWQAGSSTYTKTSGASKEYTIKGSHNGAAVAETNFTSGTLTLGTYTIKTTSSATQNGTYTVQFYNLKDYDQSGHKNKKYIGSIKVKDVTCTQ